MQVDLNTDKVSLLRQKNCIPLLNVLARSTNFTVAEEIAIDNQLLLPD
jgi:hypothetical protein